MATERDEYCVVVNDEDQYSIWPGSDRVPDGWRSEGFTGSQDECLEHVERVWVDMRPRSLREYLAPGPAHDSSVR